MLQLKLKTEYSFRKVFGRMDNAVSLCEGDAIGIADTGTWGFVKFEKACKKYDKKPIYGFSSSVFESAKSHRGAGAEFTFLAKNESGIKEIYRLCSLANEQFYWTPRLLYSDLPSIKDEDVIVLAGSGADIKNIQTLENVYLSIHPSNTKVWIDKCMQSSIPIVAVSDIYYPAPDDEEVYDVFVNDFKKTGCQFICSEEQFKTEAYKYEQDWFDNLQKIADSVEKFDLPKAENVKFKSDKSLEELCREGIVNRKLDWTEEYEARLVRELDMIASKKFEDYFFVLSDLIRHAKKKMLVGPARGSSAGSLVCYLIDITDVDPIEFDLIFERFIDVTREDLPDIDVDFPDSKRISVMRYLKGKYGKQCFGHIGTVSEYKPRSALGELGKKMEIPFNDMNDLKNTILERSSGDARAAMCIADTFTTTDLGKEMLEKYPQLSLASKIEGHVRHHGKHAAGLVVLNEDVRNYASMGRKEDEVIQLDKKDAEYLNILKIDALGLRTLSVISDCLEQVNMKREQLLETPLDDQEAFDVLNKGHYSGIFQFEGYALQSLTKQMPVEKFEDIVAITTLARPGPLHSGGASIFINRRTGKEPVTYLHDLAVNDTKDTYGVIIYQEQVMQIGRKIGNLSWEDVSNLRKAMSKSLGEEFFNAFWEKFKAGASDNGIEEKDAKQIWESMCTFGCLSGDSIIELPTSNQHSPKQLTIKELYENGGVAKIAEDKSNRGAQKGREAKIWCVKDGCIKPERLLEVYESGEKETWLLELEDGKSIRATKNHKFMTGTGWKTLEELTLGKDISVLGSKFPPKKFKGVGSGAHNKRTGQSVIFLERQKKLRTTIPYCLVCKDAPNEETHHKDGDRQNNEWDNLIPICRKCHKKLHLEMDGFLPAPFQKGRRIAWTKVKNISEPKTEMTYDIAMPTPYNNYVSNGIVSHNSWAFNRCISGECRVIMSESHRFKTMKLKSLYNLHVRNSEPIFLQSAYPDGRVKSQKVKTVFKNGWKDCYKFTFDDKTSVVCTKDHKFLVNCMWQPIGNAKIGDVFGSSRDGRSVYEKKLIRVYHAGPHMTYDIEMEEHHNYVIEGGIITHNSHAVSYGMISYWCAWLKAHYPLEYAAACLRNSKDDDQTIKTLRELVKEGFEYIPLDLERSMVNWTVQKGKLVGGLSGVKGVGIKTAENIIMRREQGLELMPGQVKRMADPVIPYSDVFECQTKFGKFYEDPELLNVQSGKPISYIEEIGNGKAIYDDEGKVDRYEKETFIFIGKLKEKNLRDLNEYGNLVKRGGEVIEKDNLFLNLVFEDDTDKIICTIGRFQYEKWGKEIVETGKIDSFYLIKGDVRNGWRKIYVSKIKLLEEKAK